METETITTHPVADLEFPTVTVCPPKGSNTALNYDLIRARNVSFTDDKREMTDANSLDPQRQSLPVAEICTIDPLLVHLFYSIKYRADATQIYNVCGTNIKKSVSIQQQIGNKTSQ